MRRWARWVSLALLAATVAVYAADWLVYSLRGSPSEKVMVSHFLSAPLKSNREEMDYLGSEDVLCAVSLFPHQGRTPCWYLQKHRNQVTNI